MTEITKQSKISPATFQDKRIKLTESQLKLLELLKERVQSGAPITRDCMLDFYLKNVKKTLGYKYHKRVYNDIEQRWEYSTEPTTKLWVDVWNIKRLAVIWFKNNLGAVIIKGKVLIVPVIED